MTMPCDPNTLQWIAGVGQPIATAGAVIAVAFAARSARAANRSAGAAEQQVALQTKPLLTDVPLEPYLGPERSYRRPTGIWSKSAWRGEIPANVEELWISVPVRNVGRGLARLTDIELRLPTAARRMTFP